MSIVRCNPILIVLAVWLIVIMPTCAVAEANPPYTRILPQQPDLQWSAVISTGACESLLADESKYTDTLKDCSSLADAIAYCKLPLIAPKRSSALVLTTMVNEMQCPDVRGGASALANAKALSSLGSPEWQDTVIRGIEEFLLERARAEVLASMAEHLKDELCSDPTGRKLFPLTCAYLDVTEPYQTAISWPLLRAAAERDLHEVPLRLVAMNIPRTTARLKDAPEMLYVTVDIAEQTISARTSLVALLVGLRTRYEPATKDCATWPASCSLYATGIAAEVILPSFGPDYQPTERFRAIAARIIFDRLVAAGVAHSADSTSWQSRLIQLVQGIQNAVAAVPVVSPKKATADDVAAYFGALSKLTREFFDAFGTPLGVSPEAQARIDNGLEAWEALVQAAAKGDYFSSSVQLTILLGAATDGHTPPWVTRYLPALGQLASAKTPDDVKNVLSEMAAPVGSYRMKRGNGNHAVTINGYLGAQGSYEWLGAGGIPTAGSYTAGLFAPIGFETSWGFGANSSFGVLVSVIDLGGVVSYRMSSSSNVYQSDNKQVTVAKEPRITFAQIFSPGLYGVLGIHGTPLALGFGGSLTPELRSVSVVGSNTNESATALRLGAFLAVDVTMLPF